MKNIGIIGNGFVGSAVLHGFILHTDNVYVYDKDKSKSNNSLRETLEKSSIIFVCLPTPMFESGKADLSIIFDFFKQISMENFDCSNKIFVLKSTIVPGTSRTLQEKYPNFNIVFSPEFLTERRARLDFINCARIVLGGHQKHTGIVKKLFRKRFPYVKIIQTSFETAEFIKYMANCFFATKVSFMNEMKQISDAINSDWDEALDGFISDGRIGNSHLDVPGHDGNLGFGGKCFPKDLNAMIQKSIELGVDPTVMKAAWKKNLEVRKDLDWHRIDGAVTKKGAKK